jgi:hypothetical protein
VTANDRQSSQLDRRRDRASAAARAAEKAQAGITELDRRLQTNATMANQQTQARRNAVAEADRLKRSLKVVTRERDRLTKARKKAAARAEKSKAKSAAAEAKYSKTVLAEMIRREKEKDRAGQSGRSSRKSPVGTKNSEPVNAVEKSRIRS